jgi:hypothetical protein
LNERELHHDHRILGKLPSVASETFLLPAAGGAGGAQKLIASGGHFDAPDALQYMKGHIFVAVSGAILHTTPNVVDIAPSTGTQKLITQGGNLVVPVALLPGPGNTIYVGDELADSTGAIFRVDLHTGAQTLIASGGYLNEPVDIAFSPGGDLVVAQALGGGGPGLGSIDSINPQTGSQTLISTGGLLSDVNGDSVNRAGDILVSSYASSSPAITASIIEVNPSTGAQSTVTSGGNLDFTAGQVVFYHSQGKGNVTTLASAAASGSGVVAGDAGLALAVDLVTHHEKGLSTSLAEPDS